MVLTTKQPTKKARRSTVVLLSIFGQCTGHSMVTSSVLNPLHRPLAYIDVTYVSYIYIGYNFNGPVTPDLRYMGWLLIMQANLRKSEVVAHQSCHSQLKFKSWKGTEAVFISFLVKIGLNESWRIARISFSLSFNTETSLKPALSSGYLEAIFNTKLALVDINSSSPLDNSS